MQQHRRRRLRRVGRRQILADNAYIYTYKYLIWTQVRLYWWHVRKVSIHIYPKAINLLYAIDNMFIKSVCWAIVNNRVVFAHCTLCYERLFWMCSQLFKLDLYNNNKRRQMHMQKQLKLWNCISLSNYIISNSNCTIIYCYRFAMKENANKIDNSLSN